MGRNILVVVAHPDDEVLGCGATIALHARRGDAVHVLILAEGVTSRDERRDPSLRKTELSGLKVAAEKARKILGARTVTLGSFPDNRMDSVTLLEIIKIIEKHMAMTRPEVVYTHHAGDVNIDHRRIHEAVVTACRPQPGSSVGLLLYFEVPSSTEWQTPGSSMTFVPNWHVDITGTLAVKLRALKAYQSEMRPWPHPRSLEAVEHLCRWRGACVGVAAAEAFMLGRHLARPR